MRLGHHFQGQKVIGQLVADVLNSHHAGTGATWRINAKILSTCRGRRHTVSPRAQLVYVVRPQCSSPVVKYVNECSDRRMAIESLSNRSCNHFFRPTSVLGFTGGGFLCPARDKQALLINDVRLQLGSRPPIRR